MLYQYYQHPTRSTTRTSRRDLVSDDDVNARARRWLGEVANVRVHGTLGERIDDRFARERPLLGPMAVRPHCPVAPRPEPRETPGRETDGSAVPRVDVERQSLKDYASAGRGGSP